VSIREVAKQARVSIATVSRTLNNHFAVDPKTAERVRKAVEVLNYLRMARPVRWFPVEAACSASLFPDITNPLLF